MCDRVYKCNKHGGSARNNIGPRAKQARTPVRPGMVRHILSTFVDYSPGWCPRADKGRNVNLFARVMPPCPGPRADNVTVWTYSPGWCPRADNVTIWTYLPGSRANSIFQSKNSSEKYHICIKNTKTPHSEHLCITSYLTHTTPN